MKRLLHIISYSLMIVFFNNCSETIELKGPPSSKKEILSFNFKDFSPAVIGDIDSAKRTIILKVPVGTNLKTPLTPTIVISNDASISPNTGVAQDFSKPPIRYFVTAADSTKKAYDVTVIGKLATDPEITGLEVYEVKTTDIFRVYGKNFSTTASKFTLLGKNASYDLKNVIVKANEATLQVPVNVPLGNYKLQVDVRGRSFKYTVLDVKVIGVGTTPIFESISTTQYRRGEEIIISGYNLAKKGVITKLRFVPQPATPGIGTVLKDAIVNADGTEVRYKIPLDFSISFFQITVVVGNEEVAVPSVVGIRR
jgi:hypothetical protein